MVAGKQLFIVLFDIGIQNMSCTLQNLSSCNLEYREQKYLQYGAILTFTQDTSLDVCMVLELLKRPKIAEYLEK